MPRVISSAQTFIVKFILPFLILGMMAFGAAIGGRGIWPFFFPLIVMVGVSIYWYYCRLKKVIVGEEYEGSKRGESFWLLVSSLELGERMS